MEETALWFKADAQKRRSVRIALASPLIVSGVDALGLSFDERTSTSIVSCHGCRYSSRYYVALDRWVTLEVVQPERGRAPLRARGRVMWMQRPRAVREPFQYGVELAVPSNFWRIAFCPEDWFSFPGGAEDRFDHETVEAIPSAASAAPSELGARADLVVDVHELRRPAAGGSRSASCTKAFSD